VDNIGRVQQVRGEICIVSDLEHVGLGNVVVFSSGAKGMVLGFKHAEAEIALFSTFVDIKKGDLVRIVAPQLTTRAGMELLGRVINPLGEPIDGKGAITYASSKEYPIEAVARPVYQRKIIDRPLQTGFLAIDSQIPIGLGQRELLLGEKNSGQNDLAIDVLCNQARLNTNLVCIYVAIDSEAAVAKRRIERLEKQGGLDRTVVIMGRTSETASLNYIAPMVGTTIAEYFTTQGKDVLIVFDNLTNHAKVYRQMSLLLERPASREAYPGDIFYLHARLLERAGAFSDDTGGGTITALPVVETQSEDATDYITTNLMSITDGHILFRQTLANRGSQPPIDSGFSVSRIGSRAQTPLVKELSDRLKGVTIRYNEILDFMSFGAELSDEAQSVFDLGIRADVLFQQTHDDFYSNIEECVLMYLVISDVVKRWDEGQVAAVRDALVSFIRKSPYDAILTPSVLLLPYDHASVVLKECIDDFLKHPATPKPLKKRERFVAEIETLSGLLQSDQEILNDKN
jgi:F-type H+-transporting ATPase subunit alpha